MLYSCRVLVHHVAARAVCAATDHQPSRVLAIMFGLPGKICARCGCEVRHARA